MLALTVPTILTFGFLTAAILSIWLPRSINQTTRIPVWMMLFAMAAIAGLYYSIVTPGGVLYLIGLGLLCHLVNRQALHKVLRILCGLAVVIMVAALFLHAIPFFNNPLVFDDVYFGGQSAAYHKYWNFDKAAAGLILLAYFGDVCRSAGDWKTMARKSAAVALITIALSLSLAVALGFIKPDVTFVQAFFVWAWANLFFTGVSEELLFRGVVQKHMLLLSANRVSRYAIVIFVGILFGLAHLGGGAVYAVLASVAGIGYGLAYYLSGRIESAILTHFLLNSVHFLFFTYPYAGNTV